MSLEEKTDVIERWIMAGCSNVNYTSSINVSLEIGQRVIRIIGHSKEQRCNILTASDQSTESTCERSMYSLPVHTMMRLIKDGGAFTVRNDCKSGSQSRPFLIVIFSLSSPPHLTNSFGDIMREVWYFNDTFKKILDYHVRCSLQVKFFTIVYSISLFYSKLLAQHTARGAHLFCELSHWYCEV